jgi:hypothetical protein
MPDQRSLAIQNSGLVAQTLDGMSRPLQRQTKREIEYAAKNAIVAHVHEESRAQLAQQAMVNCGILAMLEENLTQLAPLGSANYEAISQAFGIGTCKRLMQW